LIKLYTKAVMSSQANLLKSSGFNQLAETRDGYYLYNRNDTYIGKAIEKYGEFSTLEMNALTRMCGTDDFVIEVGANIGAHTVALARHVGLNGAVLAFEPQRLVFQALCANVAVNSLRNVYCYWAAAGAKEQQIAVPDLDPERNTNFGGLSLGTGGGGMSVPCMVLDGFLSLPRLRLLKIDVEGMESEVLAGASSLISKFKPLLYLENDRIEKSEALIRQLDTLGYDLYWHLPPLFNPNNFYGVEENIYPRIVSVNMIGIHRDNRLIADPGARISDFAFHPMHKKHSGTPK